jgi:glucokinase
MMQPDAGKIRSMKQEASEMIILAADVGGTNLNLALMARKHGRFKIVREANFLTKAEASLLEPIHRFLRQAQQGGISLKPEIACISGAGPLNGKCITLTNAAWDIDGQALEEQLGIPVHVVNDFTAICHGVMLLDPKDERQLLSIPHLDASLPIAAPQGTSLIIGAGTGLGVGYVAYAANAYQVFPSEGGHISLPLIDEETVDLWKYLRPSYPAAPGAECAVSGPGISNLLLFLVETERVRKTSTIDFILALPVDARPAEISRMASQDLVCARVMNTFVELYARVCADLCAVFIPTGGIYLAGGIAKKNEQHFLMDECFMRSFERNYREHLDVITRSTPVYIVRDNSISLFGAAQAGYIHTRIDRPG